MNFYSKRTAISLKDCPPQEAIMNNTLMMK